jgi:hypothetical protein
VNRAGEEPANSAVGFKLRAGRWFAFALRLLVFLVVMVPALAATTLLLAVTNPSVLYVERRRVLLTYSWRNAWRWVWGTPQRSVQGGR